MATITIKRTNEWVNRVRDINIYLDGVKLGSIKNNETKDLDVPAGSHTLYAKIDWAKSNSIEMELDSNDTERLLLGSFAAGRPLMILATIYYVTIGIKDYIKLERV